MQQLVTGVQKKSGEDRTRTPAENVGKTAILVQRGAESGALLTDSGENEADLLAVIDAWPTLADDVKAGIMAMVQAAGDRAEG